MTLHNQRCKECKLIFEELLIQIYGEVKPNHNLKIPAKLEDYLGSVHIKDLELIYKALQEHQGHKNFVYVKNYIAPVDFYVPKPGLIVEFDESQHFTAPRKKSLSLYPKDLELRFDKDRWKELCDIENKHDRDPPYRDEQRAWYDALRDFAPALLGIRPTIRIYAKDHPWCELDSREPTDQESFKQFLSGNNVKT